MFQDFKIITVLFLSIFIISSCVGVDFKVRELSYDQIKESQKYIRSTNLDDVAPKTEEELLSAIKDEGVNHNVEVNTENMTVTGKIRALADFFMMLEAGPSFNMEEFVEFVHQEGDLASSRPDVKWIIG